MKEELPTTADILPVPERGPGHPGGDQGCQGPLHGEGPLPGTRPTHVFYTFAARWKFQT